MQFSAAYDIFLEILHHVNQHLCQALKRDTVNWRMLNSCPACFHKLEDEPALDFEWLVSIDGNNSLKRWDSSIYGTTTQSDSRTARSDYWIHADVVDKFKDEVKSQRVSICYVYNYLLTLSFRQPWGVMITGRMSSRTQIFWEHSHVSIDGETPVQTHARKCLLYLKSWVFSSLHADIALYFSHAI